VVPVIPSPNGTVAQAQASSGTKAEIQNTLLDTFQRLYTMKALTRFSVAVLGCPVEGSAGNLLGQIRAGDVKALFFPAGEAVEMSIAASEPGAFTLHVFTPDQPRPAAFGPVEISPQDDVRLFLDAASIQLKTSRGFQR
jgi:hypothetical protein